MPASGWPSFWTSLAALACAAVAVAAPCPAQAQARDIDPVTDAELESPSPDDWLMWRRTLDGWGFRCEALISD